MATPGTVNTLARRFEAFTDTTPVTRGRRSSIQKRRSLVRLSAICRMAAEHNQQALRPPSPPVADYSVAMAESTTVSKESSSSARKYCFGRQGCETEALAHVPTVSEDMRRRLPATPPHSVGTSRASSMTNGIYSKFTDEEPGHLFRGGNDETDKALVRVLDGVPVVSEQTRRRLPCTPPHSVGTSRTSSITSGISIRVSEGEPPRCSLEAVHETDIVSAGCFRPRLFRHMVMRTVQTVIVQSRARAA